MVIANACTVYECGVFVVLSFFSYEEKSNIFQAIHFEF